MMRMGVGDSFFIPTLDPMSIIISAYAKAREAQITVVCKQALTDEVIGVRVWRIK